MGGRDEKTYTVSAAVKGKERSTENTSGAGLATVFQQFESSAPQQTDPSPALGRNESCIMIVSSDRKTIVDA